MYLSKYQIDIRSRAGRQLLSSNNRQPLHQVVLGKLFGEDAATHHILFRVTGQDLYVQSDIPPKYVGDGLTLIYTNEIPPSRISRSAMSSALTSWPCQ